MTKYPRRFDPAKKNYTSVLHTPGRFGMTYDFNDAQAMQRHQLKRLADTVQRDGNVVAGGACIVDPVTGVVHLAAGAVYASGLVHDVAAITFTVPIDRTVSIGMCVHTEIVDYTTDTDLVGQETGTRSQGEPGADRELTTARWTWDGAPPCDGVMFAVYKIVNGSLVTAAPKVAPIDDRLRRYDWEDNGHYIVNGFGVTALGYSAADKTQAFSIASGTVNVWGVKLDLPHAYRMTVKETPDLFEVAAEPHVLADDAAGPQTITLNHGPIADVLGVLVLQTVTNNVAHGPFAGVTDPLWNTSISKIVSVKQGAVTYQQGRDYILDDDAVCWSPNGANNPHPAGHQEPAPGSTYQIAYQYLANVQPDSRTTSQIVVSGATAGSTVIVHYTWALPRIDGIMVAHDGSISYVVGKSSMWAPQAPVAPTDQLIIATVTNRWGLKPLVKNTDTVALHKNELVGMRGMLFDLFDLVAQQRLLNKQIASNPAASRGLFVDPFTGDTQRDLGVSQTAVILAGNLQLPISGTSVDIQKQALPYTLPFVEETVLEQPLSTACMKINPYQVFTPLPGALALTPAYDYWTDVVTTQLADVTQVTEIFTTGFAADTATASSASTARVSSTSVNEATLRVRDVAFSASGFGAGEIVASLTFDGVGVLPAAQLVANAAGVVAGTFTIPAGLPSGTKPVVIIGRGGTRASAIYTGQGILETNVLQRTISVSVTHTRKAPGVIDPGSLDYREGNAGGDGGGGSDGGGGGGGDDPLAETFMLTEARQITSVDLRFCKIGDRTNKVVVQIRDVRSGVPVNTVFAEGVLDMAAVKTGEFTRVPLKAMTYLDAGVYYAIVIKTDDADHSLAIASLGEFDAAAQQHVTANPYTVGVLLSGSNDNTWTPHQGSDLCFRLNAAKFTASRLDIDFGNQDVANTTHLLWAATALVPAAGCSAFQTLKRPDGSQIVTPLSAPVRLGARVTERLALGITLQGTSKLSPVLFPLTQLWMGNQSDQADYVSRAVTAGANSRVDVTFEVLLPGAANVTLDVGQAPGKLNGAGYQANVALTSATPVGDGWQERTYTLRAYQLADVCAHLNLSGTPAAMPQVRNLRMGVTADPVNTTA